MRSAPLGPADGADRLRRARHRRPAERPPVGPPGHRLPGRPAHAVARHGRPEDLLPRIDPGGDPRRRARRPRLLEALPSPRARHRRHRPGPAADRVRLQGARRPPPPGGRPARRRQRAVVPERPPARDRRELGPAAARRRALHEAPASGGRCRSRCGRSPSWSPPAACGSACTGRPTWSRRLRSPCSASPWPSGSSRPPTARCGAAVMRWTRG